MGQRGQSVQIPHEARRPPAGCLLAWTGDRHRRPPSAAGAENACRAPTAGLALLYRPTAGGVPMFGDLIFRQLFDAASSTYTYLLADPQSRQGVIIDTVFEQHWRDLALVRELNIRLVAVLDTHCPDLMHGFGGGYFPPILGTRSRPAGPLPIMTLEENMTVVVQPNVIARDK